MISISLSSMSIWGCTGLYHVVHGYIILLCWVILFQTWRIFQASFRISLWHVCQGETWSDQPGAVQGWQRLWNTFATKEVTMETKSSGHRILVVQQHVYWCISIYYDLILMPFLCPYCGVLFFLFPKQCGHTWGSNGKSSGTVFIQGVLLCSPMFAPLNFDDPDSAKGPLWDVHMHFDCAGSHKPGVAATLAQTSRHSVRVGSLSLWRGVRILRSLVQPSQQILPRGLLPRYWWESFYRELVQRALNAILPRELF